MNYIHRYLRALARFMVAVHLLALAGPAAQAAMVSSESLVAPQTGHPLPANARMLNARMLKDALAREEVRARLIENGIDPAQAMARVAALSDADVAILAREFDTVPAGGGFAELILIVFITWVVIHATDALDFIFPADEDDEKQATQ
ncbi:MAG: PA2779 family protein [Gammaproteobacteria bacterium]|nr:PA2779 family protein [Gammaproteobacteria bacterium]